MRYFFFFLLTANISFAIHAQQPFTSDPLTDTGDLSARMVAGIDKYLLELTQRAKNERSSQWNFDFSSVDAFDKSILDNRNLLTSRLGLSDKRANPDMQINTDQSMQQMKIDKGDISVLSVRWKVFDNLWAEGVMITPKTNVKARVVMIPDADIIPEVLAGFTNIKGATWGSAQLLAKAGCQVVIPVLVNRESTYSGSDMLKQFTNQPHREWLYRQAYEVGRHIIGYELQKVFAVLDWFELINKKEGNTLPLGVAGYGEGGLLALYSGAIDRRLSSVLVSGHFSAQDDLWKKPIYRNVFGQLKWFGDAELAVLNWPAKLIIEYSEGPIVNGPPTPTEERSGAAPGVLNRQDYATTIDEWEKANAYVPKSKNHLSWIDDKGKFISRPFSKPVLSQFINELKIKNALNNITVSVIDSKNNWVNAEERQKRTVNDISHCVQRILQICSRTRDTIYWKPMNEATGNKEAVREEQRKKFAEQLGVVPDNPLAIHPKVRKLSESSLWTSYEVKLDVLPDVFAWGILMVPKNIKAGEKRQVVVCQHGLEGLPFDLVTKDSTAENYHYYKGLATNLAERGYITFSPHNPYRGEDKFRVLQRKANPIGLTLFSIIVAQHTQIVRWLSSLSFVDSNRIAFYGLSYGGKTAMRVPALVKGYCLSICSADFNEWVLKNATTDYDFSYLFTNEYEMPEWDLGHTFNYAEMAALIAPRPFMVERGIYDGVGIDEWVDFEFAKVRRYYMQIGIPDKCRIEHFNGPHSINGVGTFEFLDENLKNREP